ncbi:chemotaxis protein CheY [Pseudomonas sp. QLc11A]|uniref:Chemotaxis protein CheY n=1 Tax=Pseudomonas azerbaijanorientalis TaxID=2842350 RepID=A0ABW8W1N0_9PSED|nr:chemotaxis protein CheY [Stutzerimonas stutzeri]AZO92703.1 chemotaxis protein CheY [Stutzerimonas stutzeri]
MPDKSLRILIADAQHFNRLRIERLFNQLGYFRVAPVHSLDELLPLVEYAGEPLDLVLVNGTMASGGLDLFSFLADNPQVHHGYIFNEQQAPVRSVAGKVQVSQAALPDLASITQLMSTVDRRLPFVGTVISVR